MDVDIILKVVSLIFSFIVAGAALLATRYARRAASSAEKGLSTWKEQLKRKNEYDLARRLLKSIYEYEHTVKSFLTIYDFFQKQKATNQLEEQHRYNLYSAKCTEEEKKSQEICKSIKVDALESKALWGKKIKTITDEMIGFHAGLVLYIDNHLTTFAPDASDAEIIEAEREMKKYHKAFKQLIGDDNTFEKKIDALVKQAEDYLQEKLKL